MNNFEKLITFHKNDLISLNLKEKDYIDEIPKSRTELEPDFFYKFIIKYMLNINLSEKNAKKYFYKILLHKDKLSKALSREVNLQVAALDYSVQNSKTINPKIIEMRQYKKLLYLSKEDPKTGCYNEKFFKNVLKTELKRASRYNQKISIILLDIDNFKEINDKFGHLFADVILKEFTKILKKNVRDEDFVARYGGDEFIIMLPQTGRIGARCLGERVRSKLTEYFTNKKDINQELSITFSGGVSTFPYDGSSYEQLISFSDKYLYKSKHLGKNRIFDHLDILQLECKDIKIDNEKRLCQRFMIKDEGTVDLTEIDKNIPIKGRIVNISESGILIECQCQLPKYIIKKTLNIHIKQLGGEIINDLDISGNLVRLNKYDEDLKFSIALKFRESLDDNHWNKLEKHAILYSA